MSKHTQVRKSIRRRKVANAAANSRKYTVNNNTIPKNITVTEKHYDESIIENYKKVRELFKKGRDPKKKSKKPWYMVTKKEQKVFNAKLDTNTKLNRVELMERLVQYKLSKWTIKNPRPIKEDLPYKDLFESQYIPEWNKRKEEAEEHIRDVVVSMYRKLRIVACVVNKHTGNTIYVPIATVRDIDCEGHFTNNGSLKKGESKLLAYCQEKMDEFEPYIKLLEKNNTSVTGIGLENHKRNSYVTISGVLREQSRSAA